MTSIPPLPVTLERIRALLLEQDTLHAQLLDPRSLAARTALPEETVRTLLRGGEPPEDTVTDRVRTRIKTLADAHLARCGRPMSDLAGSISQQLGVSAFWARKVCSGEKVPSVELLHGLVGFFGVPRGEAFFTAPAPEALNRALLRILSDLRPSPDAADTAAAPPSAGSLTGHDDVRGIALRRARDLPQERWKVLSATLQALLELDNEEEK